VKHTTITYKGDLRFNVIKIQGSEPEAVLKDFAKVVTRDGQSVVDILDIQWHKSSAHITYTVS